jgi:hypothetical protein
MANKSNSYEVIQEHGSGLVRIVELRNGRGYIKFRPEKIYFWDGSHRRTQLLSSGDYMELVFVLVESGILKRSELMDMLEAYDDSEGMLAEGDDGEGGEDRNLPPF